MLPVRMTNDVHRVIQHLLHYNPESARPLNHWRRDQVIQVIVQLFGTLPASDPHDRPGDRESFANWMQNNGWGVWVWESPFRRQAVLPL